MGSEHRYRIVARVSYFFSLLKRFFYRENDYFGRNSSPDLQFVRRRFTGNDKCRDNSSCRSRSQYSHERNRHDADTYGYTRGHNAETYGYTRGHDADTYGYTRGHNAVTYGYTREAGRTP